MNLLENIDDFLKKELAQIINLVIENKESAIADEKKRQKAASAEISKRDLRASDSSKKVKEAEDESEPAAEEKKKREDRTGGKGTPDSKKAKTPDQKKFANPTMVDIVDKINVIRGGGSLKDSGVRKSFETYFNSLNLEEKQALLIYLTGVAQVLVGSKKGAEAIDPGEIGLRVKKQAQSDKSSVQKVLKKGGSKAGSAAPIVVGEAQKKDGIYEILHKLREK